MVLKKILVTLLTLITSFNLVSAVTTITLVSDYGAKNYLLALYCVLVFIFWIVVYNFTPDFEFSKDNLVKSITGILSKSVCWIWFLGLFYILKSILFVSTNVNFLEGKLVMFNSMFYITILLFGFVGIINALKFFKNISGVENFFKELNYEIKTGGKK